MIKLAQHGVFEGGHVFKALSEQVLFKQLADLHADLGVFIRIKRGDAGLGGAEAALAQAGFLVAVQRHVVVHEHLRPVGNQQLRRPPGAAAHLLDLAEQGLDVQGHAHADHVHHVRMKHPGRQQMQGELALVRNNGMARVGAALKADHDVALAGQKIRDFSFSLVAPVGADDRSHHSVAPSGPF